jgi:predicted nucleic acid-binding protein
MQRGVDTSFLVELAVTSSPAHEKVQRCFDSVLLEGATLVLTLPIVAEFVHVTTDTKRFPKALSMPEALQKAEEYWYAVETRRLHSTDLAGGAFLRWMAQYRLGRKRVLDTMFAAALQSAGVTSLLTLNPSDFRIFDCFEFHPDLA